MRLVLRDPLLLPGALLAVAVALWPAWRPEPWPCLCGAAACGLLAVLGGERLVGWLAVWVGAALLGSAAPGLRGPGPELHGHVSVEGVVESGTQNTADIALTRVGEAPARGRLRLRTQERAPKPGDRVAAFGSARPLWDGVLPGESDPEWTAALDGVHTVVLAEQWVLLGPEVSRAGPHPFDFAEHGGLLRAIALNDRSQLPEDERALLRDTGTSHLLAISGLHIGIIAAMAYRLVSLCTRPLVLWWGRGGLRWAGAAAGVAAALGFTAMVGWPIPAQRAAWMIAGSMVGMASSRGVRAWNLLGMAAAVVVLAEPSSVRSVSFQLSFGAIAGMLATGPALGRLLPPDLPRGLSWLAQALITTAGATLGTLPVCALTFQALPLCSPLANLVAIPLMSTVAVPAALLGSMGFMLPTAVADSACDLTLRWLSWVQGPIWHPAVGPMGALALCGLPFLLRRPGLAGLLLLVVFGLRERPTDLLRVSFLSVGQGDAALVQLGDGRTLLIDGGPPGDEVLRWLRRAGITRLDEVLLTHPHPDHSGGLTAVFESLDVGTLRVPRLAKADEDDFQALLALAEQRGAQIRGPQAPTLDPQHMRILHPSPAFFAAYPKANTNDQSIVLRVQMGGRTLLFTGDIEKRAEAWISPQLGAVDLLKVPHHGSHTSSTPALLDATRPAMAVVSCGRENRFGHPHPEVTRRYARLHRTDRDGTLELRLSRQKLRFRTWKPGSSWSAWTAWSAATSPRPPPGR